LTRRTPDEHIRGFDFPSQDFFGKFCHVAKVGDMGPAVRKNGRWKRLDFSKPRRTHTQRFPGNTRGFNSTANRSIAQLFHCLASPPRAFTRASTRHEISLVNRKKSASSRCATSSLSISEFCSSNSSANLTLVRLKLWSSVNLMRFCQSSANLVTSLPASRCVEISSLPKS